MSPPKYALVFWEQENMYSAVSTKQISGFEKDNPDHQLGAMVKVLWGKELCDGRLLQLGSRQSMKKQENERSRAAAETSFAERELIEAGGESPFVNGDDDLFNENEQVDHHHHAEVLNRQSPASPILTAEALHGIQDDHRQAEGAVDDQLSEQGLRAELAKARAQLQERDFENRRLKRALKKSNSRIESDTVLESIRDNFSLPKSFLDFLKLSYLGNPSLFMRRMVFDSNLFTLEELAASSISGKKCPLSLGAARPALDLFV